MRDKKDSEYRKERWEKDNKERPLKIPYKDLKADPWCKKYQVVEVHEWEIRNMDMLK